jgi:putative ABC transport system permease protein
MAWRDSRKSRRRLLLFSASIMAGIAALVAIGSLRDSLLLALENEARGMLGGDVYVHAKRPFSNRANEILAADGARIQREVAYTTMARVADSKAARLVQARAADPDYPFHGTPVTDPPDAWQRCLAGEGFVADAALMASLEIETGRRLRIGSLELPLLGSFLRPPPQVSLMGAFAPELFFARSLAPQTGLRDASGFTFHRAWLVFPDGYDVEKNFAARHRSALRSEGISTETVEGRKKSARRVLEIVYSFLSLMAFIALVLGGVGIASAMQVHASERIPTVATLRCLGCTASRALAVYLIQGLGLGLAGSLGGVTLGLAAAWAIPTFLNSVLPVTVTPKLAPQTIFMALGFGFLLCVCFALLPLLRVRRVPAMAAVRAQITGGASPWRDPAAWILIPAVAASLTWLAIQLSPPDAPRVGIGFAVAIAAGLALLAATGTVLMKLVRLAVRPSWPFAIRQGLAGLHRPRNQTTLFLMSVGLGSALVLVTVLAQHLLTGFFDGNAFRGKPNFFATDAPPDAREKTIALMTASGATVDGSAPIVLLSLAALNGQTLDQIQEKERNQRPSGWSLTNVYRASWNKELMGSSPPPPPGSAIPISLEEGLLGQLKLKRDQTITFRAGEREILCLIKRTHTAAWENMFASFPVIFPEGALEGFDHTWAFAARTSGTRQSAILQRDLTAAVPGITVFDVAAMTAILENLLDRGIWVIRALSLLTVLTGCIIVVAILLAGRRDRLEESVTLRTLGASRQQIRSILVSEYVILGFTAALTGAVLAAAYAWLLATYVFKVPFHTLLWPLAWAILIVAALTAALGMFLSRGIASHPPLAILRGSD